MASWPANKQALQGIIPPLVTPLLDPETIDRDATRRVLEHVIEGGVAGIFLLGTTGEGPSLSIEMKKEFIGLCCEVVKDRVPILVGITDCSLTETINMAKVSKQAGATAVVLTSPFFFPIDQDDLLRFVKRVLPSVELPVMLYNMPGLTKVWFEIETLQELIKEPNIVGIKDSSGDLEYFEKVCRLKSLRNDWTILIGPEHLTADAVRLGADGGVNGGANIEPKLFVGLCQAALQGNQPKLQERKEQVDALQAIYRVKKGFPFVTATKCAMSLRGICTDVMAEPFAPFSEQEREQVKSIMNGLSNVELDK
jgi:4-hydroxy-tetrahydrodipicolinate synthase